MGDIIAVRLIRGVSTNECPWLDAPLLAGELLYIYPGYTYGAIRDGMPLTREPGEPPFFEVPRDAIGAAG